MNYIYNLRFLFEEMVNLYPQNTALIDQHGVELTYDELNILSNRIAHLLINRDIRKNNVVAIFNQKDIYCYACMISCLKIGAIYVNLDYTSPQERLLKMINVCKPSIIWSTEELFSLNKDCLKDITFEDYQSNRTISEINSQSKKSPDLTYQIDGNSPAYIMFTSGSTGFPKGAVMSHENLINFISWSKSTFSISSQDRLTNLNPMHFDNSVFDFYASIFSGAAMIGIDEATVKSPMLLVKKINFYNCTIWFSVPSLLVFIIKMRAFSSNDMSALKMFIFGGEAFPKKPLRDLANLFFNKIKFFNVYGPTECTCICSSYQVNLDDLKDDKILPLGKIATNFNFLVLDLNMKEAGDGNIGELFLSGPNVGLGYYDDKERTEKSFFQSPANKYFREIVYKTGDLVKFDKKNNLLFFCGRSDNQIKRMGYRIELEEIEAAIGSLNYVCETAVIYKDHDMEIGKIIAFVSSSLNDEFKFIADLRKKIPAYMIPDKVFFYDTLPKNQNGKIDRRVLFFKNEEKL